MNKAANSRVIVLFATFMAVAVMMLTTNANAQNNKAGGKKGKAASQESAGGGEDSLAKYLEAMADIESFDKYNKHLEGQVESQKIEIASIEASIKQVESTSRDVLPLIEKMLEALEKFVALDLPFLKEERAERIKKLKDMMADTNVSVPEKYRRILEAYQVELQYGRELETYEGELTSGGVKRTVDFIRLGRVTLAYRSRDGKETGYWDTEKKTWVRDDTYTVVIRAALRVAKKQGAPDLLFMPVPAARKVTK